MSYRLAGIRLFLVCILEGWGQLRPIDSDVL